MAYLPNVDEASGALNSIDSTHHEIHEGNSFFFTTTMNLAVSETANFFIFAPNTTDRVHLFPKVDVSEIVCMRLYEGCFGTTAGYLSTVNRNRNSTKTSSVTIATVASITTQGTLLCQEIIGSNGNGNQPRGTEEVILAQGSCYNLRLISILTNNIIGLQPTWYER